MKNKQIILLKRIVFILVAVLAFSISTNAAFLKNVPQKLTQPDGTVINIFATGDEYYSWLHDNNNFTIVLNPISKF